MRLSCCAAEGIVGLAVEIRFAAAHARQALQLAVEGAAEHLLLHARLAEEELRDVLASRQHARKQMGAADGLMTQGLCAVDGMLHGLLGLDGEVVEFHKLLFFDLIDAIDITIVYREIAQTVCQSLFC